MTADQTSDREPSFAPGDPASLNLIAGIVQDGTPDFMPLSVRYGLAEKVLIALDLPARDNAVARDALDGLAEQHTRDANVPGIPDPIRRGLLLMADEARAFRDRTYPTCKETPNA